MQITGNKVVLNLTGADNMRHVETGDYVSHLRSFQGGLEYARIPGKVSAAYTVLKPKVALDSRFFRYLFKSELYVQALQTTTDQLRDGQSIRYPQFSQIALPQPSLDEQRAIADYLDRETAQIDAFIAKNEELIALLAERRAATITSALTSGREESTGSCDGRWFGAIPAHWESMPLRYLLRRIEQGVSPQAEGGLAEGAHQFGVLKSGCVNAGIYRSTEHKLLPAEFDFDRSLLVRPGDLVVNRASGSIPLLGSAAIVTQSPYRLILSDKTFRLIPNARTSSHYLYWLLNSRIYREQVESRVSGADGLANNLPQSTLKRFVLPVPPIEEQDQISSYLTDRCTQIDKSIATARRGAALARERRAALISAAVTGKVDGREAS